MTGVSNLSVFVGMSGGVDSSVAAALLQKQGYQVTGVYMKNWSQDLPGLKCPWRDDYLDAKRVAVQLGIPFKLYDFEKLYRQKVVDYLLEEYQAGRTPNPDVMCNQEIKFHLFLRTALEDGAQLIATGHYARVIDDQLFMAKDLNKDQSYFLYRVTNQALRRTLMPLGKYRKSETRALAKKLGLVTAEKKDSQGICFIGNVGIKDFLLYELGEQKPGPIIDQHGQLVGQHEGALFYTIGQRHGLSVGGGLPYYIVGKNMLKNEIYVTTDLQDKKLWTKNIEIADLHWINELPSSDKTYQARVRYRAGVINCRLVLKQNRARVRLEDEARAVTPGQSVVIYDQDRVVGGGIVI